MSNTVALGSNVVYNFTPGTNYRVGSVTVDGSNKGALASCTFRNVQGTTHTIAVTFIPDTYTISISVPGRNMGNITNNVDSTTINSGTNTTQTVAKGTSITSFFNPNTGYSVSGVVANGVSQGALGSYTFNKVTFNQSLSVTFVKNP